MGVAESLESLGYLFYVASPNRTSFETIEEVPEYTVKVMPYFVTLVLLEQAIRLCKRKPLLRVNDAIGSLSQGMMEELVRIVLHSWQLAAYVMVYERFRVATLPWNSAWTWWACFVLVDFCYYWAHRASHEINFLWAAHQVHHSSEEYNLTTALRQSVIQGYLLPYFYLPMALAVPPSVYLVHTQLNLLYQFWIHTEVISSLGPLEYILNTASHHRVHHGRNRYCIDKNYGGTLIIWDRIFGTFEAENEEVVYGLTHPINTFEPLYIQLCHYMHIWRTFWEMEGLKNKLSVIFKGPGWSPGKPWHGHLEDIPDVTAPVQNYDPKMPKWFKMYVLWHFTLITIGFMEIMDLHFELPTNVLYAAIIYQVFSYSVIGILNEGRLYAPWMELMRCGFYFLLDYHLMPVTRVALLPGMYKLLVLILFRGSYLASVLFWLIYNIKNVTIKFHTKKVE